MFARLFEKIKGVFRKVSEFRRRVDERMEDTNAPTILALCTCCALLLVMVIILFIPPYLGVSNDGSFASILQDVGLARIDERNDEAYFSYYERQYQIRDSAYKPGTTPAPLRVIVQTAIWLDTFFTRDLIFDVRPLALLYVVLYMLAVYPTVLFALQRAKLFSEGIIISVVAFFIFGDVSFITRFASFYTQPLEMICLVAMVGLMFRMIKSQRHFWPLLLFLFATIVLLSLNAYVGVAGLVFAALCLLVQSVRKDMLWKASCVACALIISFFCFGAIDKLEIAESDVRKYNAMTRGVLYQSTDPVKTLAEFGIPARYSLLTDTYADQNYPLAFVEDDILQFGFLDQYTIGDIVAHYLRNPAQLLNMVDIGVQASFTSRPDFSGNYEQSRGLPARAKSPFMAIWSTFKSQSAPRTIGFFIIVGLVILLSFRQNLKPGVKVSEETRLSGAIVGTMLALMIFALAEITTVVIYSGDTELLRESFIFGVCLDLMILFAFSELLHRLQTIRIKR
jgi:hypothetical protein